MVIQEWNLSYTKTLSTRGGRLAEGVYLQEGLFRTSIPSARGFVFLKISIKTMVFS
jgi:hypothetical protein